MRRLEKAQIIPILETNSKLFEVARKRHLVKIVKVKLNLE